MSITNKLTLTAICSAIALGHAHGAVTAIQVTGIGAPTGAPAADAWYYTEAPKAGATATIQAVPTTIGFNDALGSSAAVLTLPATNDAKAEVGTYKDFGLASSVLSNIGLSYQYYKTATAGGAAQAPAIKLQIQEFGGTGDNYGVLVYEPYYNSGNGAVVTDTWLTENINPTTGSLDDSAGGWWWNGGFELPNSFGGAPLRSLAEWAALFATSDPLDFPNAHVTGLLVGMGSYNPDQIGYFDGVSYTLGGNTTTYDFEAAAPVPEPASALFGLALLGTVGLARRRSAVAA